MQESSESAYNIDELTNHGIQPNDLLKLKQAGICTIKGISMISKRNLCKIKGLSEAKVDKIKESISKILCTDFITANDYALKREMIKRITTGSSDFDTLLGGGIQTMAITEVFGEFRTGKTQLAHTLCVTNSLDGGKSAYIDTEGTFRPERLKEIASRFEIDSETILQNIIVARAFNSEHQNELLDKISLLFAEDSKFSLIVVDSVISLFRTDYVGRGELGERQQRLNQFLSKLMRIAEEYNVAVFITNQMMSDPGGSVTFVADPKKPIGGHVLAHASTTRIYLRKGRNETRVAKIYDSPDVPESEAVYAITEGGIDNTTE